LGTYTIYKNLYLEPNFFSKLLEALFDIKYRSLSGRLNKCFFFSKVENDAKQDESQGFGCCDYALIGLSYLIGLFTLPIFIIMSIKIIKEYERAVIMRLGRINGGAKGPGLFWVLPCTDSIQVIDLRTVTFDVPPQEILTKDSVTVAVDAVCYFRTFNPVIAVTQAENATVSTRQLAATTLRNILGMRTLQEILQEKEEIASDMQRHLDSVTHSW